MQKDAILNGLAPDAITKVAEILDSPAESELSALELYIWLKRAQALAGELMTNIVAEANDVFGKLAQANPTAKAWQATDFATVARLTPPGSWTYPKELALLEADLKARKEEAKKSGLATHIPASPDPGKSPTFKVQLQQV